MEDLKYWLGFNLVKGIGPAKQQALLDAFGSMGAAWQAAPTQLAKLGLDQRAIKNLVAARGEFDLDSWLRRVRHAGVALLTWDSPGYPSYLREIPNSPPLLYVRGDIVAQDQWAVAVVGTRRITRYGRQLTEDLVAGLVQQGVTIVSGLARGVDAVAHKTAVEMGGRTLAVLGSGVDNLYPAENRKLGEAIINGQGAVISDYPLGTRPDGKNFPPRNRIISGLSLGVLVIEAGERSGALITTRFALEQDREVFALPGNVNSPASKGTNGLIQQGAKLVMDVNDILEELNLQQVVEHTAVQMALPETAEEAAVLAALSAQPVHVDDICRETGLPTSLVSSTLTLMELKGMVRQMSGMNYILGREPGPVYDVNQEQS